MIRRFFLGLFEGLFVGVGFGVLSVRVFGLVTPNRLLSALLAAAVGFVVGLIAGRPIWAKGKQTEALLKGAAGALVGAGLSVALGKWLTSPVDLSDFSLGVGPVGRLSAVSLPAIACALSLFFELDDSTTHTTRMSRSGPQRHRIDVDREADMLDEDVESESKREVERH